jgi:deoxyribodipyrimidine photo-lyase
MITASFLCKDLLQNWQDGEHHFSRLLIDGEPAVNNGNWQWAASTGTDAQPYFRIFNPTTQGRRFDPSGEYVRTWVPELKLLSADEIHEPWKSNNKVKYSPPIIDHAQQRGRAIAFFKGRHPN